MLGTQYKMKHWSLNSKILAIALLPSLIISILLGSYFVLEIFHQANQRIESEGQAIVQQLSPSAKYALITNNQQILQALTNTTLENPMVKAIAIFDTKGRLAAYDGPDNLIPKNLQSYENKLANSAHFLQPIVIQQQTLNNYPQIKGDNAYAVGDTLGWVFVDISNASNNYIKIEAILVALLISIIGLIIGFMLARFLRQLISRPFTSISKAIANLQNEHFDYKIPTLAGKEFQKISADLKKLKVKMEHFDERHQEALQQETEDLNNALEKIEIRNIELNMVLKNAQRDNRRKSEFIASLSHEIRTPMSSIIGFTNLMLESELSKYQKEYLVTIKKSANTMLAIINDILDFSKIEAGKFKLDNIPFDYADTLDEVLQSLSPEAQKKQLELVTLVNEKVPQKLIGDPLRLKQIFTNLVYNAIKFTEKGGVSVQTDLINDKNNYIFLSIKVSDTGIGLSEKQQKNLFKAFNQADISIARKFGGTGLGLVISKQLIEQMGGHIEVKSTPGKGTTLQFNLKFIGLQDNESLTSKAPVIEKNILAYEPHLLARQSIKTNLQSKVTGLLLTENLPDLKKALDSNEKYDHVILSLTNNDLHDLKTADLIKELRKKNNLIITTIINNSSEMIINDLLNFGAHNCIVKPISAKKLLEAIKNESSTFKYHEWTLEPQTIITHENNHSTYSHYNILVAEDNPANLKLLTSLLRNLDIGVETATNGFDALEKSKAKSYDLILLDLQMPKMDGLATCQAIRGDASLNQKTPIIAISAFIATEERASLMEAGFNELLIKPLDTSTLDYMVKKWVGHTNAQTKMAEKKSSPLPAFPLDLQKTIELSAGNKQLAIEIINLFIEELPNLKKALSRTYQNKEFGELTKIVHKLHGSSKFCAMHHLQKSALELEESLRRQNYDNVNDLYQTMITHLNEVEHYIKKSLVDEIQS